MRVQRWAVSLFALTLVSVSACGGENSGPTEPESYTLSVVDGNNQRGFPHVDLARPVVVEVKSGQEPAVAERVDFSVALGAASVTPHSQLTDQHGRISASVRLGAVAGPVWIRAETPELSTEPVQATLEVLGEGEATLLNPDVGLAYDLVLDVPRQRAYLTRHEEATVEAFSIQSGAELWSLPVDGTPYGASLSLDGAELFVALAESGMVGAVDLETLDVEYIAVAEVTGHTKTWDVLEATPGALFVSANAGVLGDAFIAKVERSDPARAVRVASGEEIEDEPTFLRSLDGTALFVAHESAGNALYRLDLTQPAAPIDLKANGVGDVWWISTDRAGKRIYLGGDQVIDAESLERVGTLPSGAKVTSLDDSIVFVFNANGFRAYETEGFQWIGDVDLPTSHADVRLSIIAGTNQVVMHEYSSGELWLVDLIR